MQGKIVEYVEQGRFYCAVVLSEQGKRLRVINQNGREMNLPVARVVHQGNQSFPTSLTREETMRMLQEVSGTRQHGAESIDLEEIWELAVEEQQTAFTPLFLTELCFAEAVGDDQVASFLRAVFANRFFFKFKDSRINVHSREVVEQLQVKAEKEKVRQEMMERGAVALSALMAGAEVPEWPDRQKVLGLIAQYYLHGNDEPEAAFIREMLKKAGLSRPHDPYYILIKAGVWHRDENVALLKQELALDFDDELLLRAANIAAPNEETLLDGHRLDLRDLPLITIDGEATRDFDDALHIAKEGDGYLVGIHIADVSEYVKADDPLFNEARQRGTSIYFADRQIPMLPRALSEGACSLIEGKSRPALSFMVSMAQSGEVIDFKLVRSVVRVQRRITYNQAEALLAAGDDEDLQVLADLSRKIQERRLADGALIIPIPDVNVHVERDGRVTVHLAEVDSLSRTLVAEFMVLANTLAAQYLADREIPGLFRSQEKPRKRLSQGVAKDLFTNFRQRRFLARGQLLTEAKPHSGVGVSQYTTITSPIRRMLDLVMQQQLTHVLQGKGPLYSLSDCKDFSHAILAAQGRANQVRQQRHRYWLLKYLAMEVGQGRLLDALVLDIQPRRVQVVLTDILLEGDLPRNQGAAVSPGDMIQVKLAKVSPLDNSFRLEW